MSQPWVISLLSTDYDLHEHRSQIIKEFKNNGVITSAFELPDFPVEPTEHSHANCLIALDRADIAILLIDKRYGGIYFSETDISITEKEYIQALETGKPCLVFVSEKAWDERHQYRRRFKSSGKSKVEFDKDYECLYVEKISTVEFIDHIQEAYEKNNCSNWISFFSDIKDLVDKINGKLEGLSRYFIEKIIESQRKEIINRHTSTGLSMSLGDVFNKGYYIEPAYTVESGYVESEDVPLDERIVNSIVKKSSILVYGEAGYGKTTILAKSFLNHSTQFLNEKAYHIPFYLWLKKKSGEYHFDFSKYIDDCFEEHLEKDIYPYMSLNGLSPYFYLDGFDELAEKLSMDEIVKISNSKIFHNPILLTCRYQYALRYLNYPDFSDRFGIRIKADIWNIDKAKTYISNFCNIQDKDEQYAQKIYTLLAKNEDLSGILDSPLFITMLLWIIEQRKMNMPNNIRSRVALFNECVQQLSRREQSRLGLKDLSHNDIIQIWTHAAWVFYKNKILGRITKTTELLDEIKNNLLPDLSKNYNESLLDVVFDIYDDRVYGTLHEQFLEFLVAYRVFSSCIEKKYPYPEFLEYVMRPEMNRYFRGLWSESTEKEKMDVVNAINEQYKISIIDNSAKSVAKRVHAIYHISRLDSDTREEMMDNAFSIEKHISVRLSLFFGAIKMGRLSDEENFYELLISSNEYNTANRGYHLAYYSDSIIDNHLPFLDDGQVAWGGTLKAFQRHFESKKIGHYFLRRIDIITMLQLMESRNSAEPLNDKIMDLFESFVYNPPFNEYPNYQRGIEAAFEQVRAMYNKMTARTR